MIEKILTFLRLTLSCQSGRSAAGLALAIAAVPAVAGSASWAHQAGSLSSNGAVTVKSLAGGSYAATQNPTGAVAKANQVASTQPPTVIIQATGSSNSECVPKTGNSATPPACDAGYSSVWSKSGTACISPILNVGGTRHHFVPEYWDSYNTAMTFAQDELLRSSVFSPVTGTGTVVRMPAANCGGAYTWSASLCCK